MLPSARHYRKPSEKTFSKKHSSCIISHMIWLFMLCRASAFSGACRRICFIHFFFSALFHVSKSKTLFPSGWATRRRWKALLLFSLPYAPETVPRSASDYPQVQMLCHPLPPETLNSKICLHGMGAQSLEGLGCECSDLIIIAAVNKCSKNDRSLLSMQRCELLRINQNKNAHGCCICALFQQPTSHRSVSSSATKPAACSASGTVAAQQWVMVSVTRWATFISWNQVFIYRGKKKKKSNSSCNLLKH